MDLVGGVPTGPSKARSVNPTPPPLRIGVRFREGFGAQLRTGVQVPTEGVAYAN